MALDDDIRDMARLPIFQEIEPDALRLLAFSAETRIFRTGDVLFRRGDPSDAGYFVISGSFRIEDPARHGGEAPAVTAYALIGEIALLTETERPATIVAREPATVLKITRTVFHRVLREYPKSALRLRAALEARLAGFSMAPAFEPGSADLLKTSG
jgi:CRP-like cAMP-binding protein